MYFSPHMAIAFMIGIRSFPLSVRKYLFRTGFVWYGSFFMTP